MIDAVAKGINDAPARLRGAYFVGAITGDVNVLEDRLADAGSAYREIDHLVTEFADARDRGRDQRPQGRHCVTRRRHGSPSLESVRDLIERQVTPRGVREFSRGSRARRAQRAEAIARHSLAHDIEDAGSKLQDDSLSLREHLTAAVDVAEYESIAADQFGATSGSD